MILRSVLFIVFLSATFTGCSSQLAMAPTKPNWLAPLDAGAWVEKSAGKPYSVTKSSFAGRNSLRFEIRQGDAWEAEGVRTFRTEISTNEFPPMGSEKWYAFSVFIPSDFPIEDNRLVLAQWWAKTKTQLGEAPRSPILSLRFAEGKMAILLRRYPRKVAHKDDNFIQTDLFSKNLELGKWQDFVFHVKWSPAKDGFVEAWWNSEKVVEFEGITENQDDIGPVFKFGLYRDDSSKTYVSYFSDVFVGDTSESVHANVK
jgi:hypothetical protein